MRKKRHQHLLFLVLLLLWGQALAAPFLACRHSLDAQVADAHQHSAMHAIHEHAVAETSDHCAGMSPVPAQQRSAAGEHGHAGQQQAMHDQHQSGLDCELLCQVFCLGTAPAAVVSLLVQQASAISGYPMLDTPFPAIQPPASLFRPPAAA